MSSGSPSAYLLWAILASTVSLASSCIIHRNIQFFRFSFKHSWSTTYGAMTDSNVSNGTLDVSQALSKES